MTFDKLLNGIKGLESHRDQKQIDCFAEKIAPIWGNKGVYIFRTSLTQDPEGNFYIPENYDHFTIASLIAS